MSDISIPDAAPPEESRPQDTSTPTQDAHNEVARTPWSIEERLFIQLQAGFALAAATLPICTVLPPTGQSYYNVFRRFFDTVQPGTAEATSDQNTTAIQRSQEEYLFQQQELVHGALSRTDELVRKAMNSGEFMRGKMWTVEQEVFDEYRKICEEIGLDLRIEDLRHNKEVFGFLYRIVCERFPESCGHTPTGSDMDVSEATADDDMPDSDADSAASEADFEDTRSPSPAQDDAQAVKKTTRRANTRDAKPTDASEDNNTSRQVRKSGRRVNVADKAREPQTGTKRPRRSTTMEEESEEETEDGEENIAVDEEEDEIKAPLKKRIKPTGRPKATKGHGENRKKNDAWTNAERNVIVAFFNNKISEQGLIYWVNNLNDMMNDATTAVNAYRALDATTYPGGPRGMDGVRSQIHKKPGYQLIKTQAEELRAKNANPKKTVSEAELKPRDLFKLADIEPGRSRG
ncbi:hypothetical protein BKA58DRAFT_433127 [Alternaria rosae]|uniref:uncharacterized protein n=1 Tax=Alternaria rosae TaxID=1187941 RepID=UPI001E8DB9C0|nr:uncharacterized protein BKA58DRAFT_433127 [Alternaria rosae]KAH6881334.1 hypothetical protein BKA58DRAFT_433127 [Alternaria rosae]